MSHGAGDRHDAARRVRSHRHGAAAAIIALLAAFAFGAIDQYLGALSWPVLTEVSGMSAAWLLVPFLAGAGQAGPRRAALIGLAATWLAVLGYVVMVVSPVEGTQLGPRPAGVAGSWNQLTPHLFLMSLRSQWLWFAGGLITGPLYGWLGYSWRARRSWAAALLAALPVLFEPAARWLAAHVSLVSATGLAVQQPGHGPAVIAGVAEAAVGLALTGVVLTAMLRARAARSTGTPGAPVPGASP